MLGIYKQDFSKIVCNLKRISGGTPPTPTLPARGRGTLSFSPFYCRLRRAGGLCVNALSGLALVFALSACTLFKPPPAHMPDRANIRPGETVVVKGKENVYTIALEHNVSMRALIVLNDLKPPYEVRPGQKLVLPADDINATYSNEMKAPDAAPLAPVEKNNLSPLTPAAVSSQELAPPPPPPAKTVPQASVTQQDPLVRAPVATKPVASTAAPVATETASAASVPEAAISMKWPVKGPVLSSFGPKGPGLNNDGVNIGAPKGAPVVAAAAGMVVYAGSDMKGFGNLVLIRHQGDLVTAYAHLDRVLVKKDSIVVQGDMIGTVGKTGNVSTPQLHFEIRRDSKPVDPALYIKNAA